MLYIEESEIRLSFGRDIVKQGRNNCKTEENVQQTSNSRQRLLGGQCDVQLVDWSSGTTW